MKQSDINNLSTDQLRDKIKVTKKAYADLKIAHAISPISNPLQIRSVRRTVARLATELTKRDLQ
jgi:large subunit ribosomal protein L29